MNSVSKTVFLAKPRGFCAGVIRAIDIVNIALEKLGTPVYVRKEIVHNRFVVDELAAKGAVFVDSLEEVPDGSIAIFSAHGVAPQVWNDARQRKLHVIDATCPLVMKVHIEVVRYARLDYSIILIGHPNHDEVIGTFGEAPDSIHVVANVADVDALENVNPDRVVFVTQTTLSLDDTSAIVGRLKQRFPTIIGPSTSDICYATQNRQSAVKVLARNADVILVVGAQNSSNSNRLVEVAQSSGIAAHLISSARDVREEWLGSCVSVGVTAGASTPEILVQEVVQNLRLRGFTRVEQLDVIDEDVYFPLPVLVEQSDRVVS